MDKHFTEKESAFLAELTELSKKHGIIVTGCGCCGSPSLHMQDCSNDQSGYGRDSSCDFAWVEPGSYEFDKYKNTIQKKLTT